MPAGESGKLFGSVNNSVIADALAKEGITVEKKKIEVPEQNIKMIGNYNIKVKLYANQTAMLKVAVSASETVETESKTEAKTETKAEAKPEPETEKK